MGKNQVRSSRAGGLARAAALSPSRRSEIARIAATSRWRGVVPGLGRLVESGARNALAEHVMAEFWHSRGPSAFRAACAASLRERLSASLIDVVERVGRGRPR